MKTERNLINIASVMFALNFSILAFYSLICMTTTFRICESLGANIFLNSVRQIPQYPWRMLIQSLSLYALLCGVSFFKNFHPIEFFPLRVVICLVEIVLCAGIIVSVNFYSLEREPPAMQVGKKEFYLCPENKPPDDRA